MYRKKEVSSTHDIIWNAEFSASKMQSKPKDDKKQTNTTTTKGKPNKTEQKHTKPVLAGAAHDPDLQLGDPEPHQGSRLWSESARPSIQKKPACPESPWVRTFLENLFTASNFPSSYGTFA